MTDNKPPPWLDLAPIPRPDRPTIPTLRKEHAQETEAEHYRQRYLEVAQQLAHQCAQPSQCAGCVVALAELDCVAQQLGEGRMIAAGGVHYEAVKALLDTLEGLLDLCDEDPPAGYESRAPEVTP